MTEDNLATVEHIDLDEYMEFTRSTVVYNPLAEGDYVTAGLVGEVGEMYSAIAKFHRGDYNIFEFKARLFAEMGDILWFLARIADYYDFSLENILKANMQKLRDRQSRNKIQGDGDER